MLTHPYKLVPAASLVFGLTLSGVALSQDAGLYINGNVGWSSADFINPAIANAGLTDIDDTDTAWKVNLGYQFNRNWSVEVGYVDFGNFSFRGNVGDPPVAASAGADITAWTIAGVGTLPLGDSDFSLFAKIGFARAKVEFTGAVRLDDKSTDLFGGIGIRYDVNKNFGVLLEVERYTFDDKINMYTVGVRYKF